MTESEWLASADPRPMLEFVAARATDRKLRLFLYVCCLRVLDGTPTHRRLFRGYYPVALSVKTSQISAL
jgi:hypothetical protein